MSPMVKRPTASRAKRAEPATTRTLVAPTDRIVRDESPTWENLHALFADPGETVEQFRARKVAESEVVESTDDYLKRRFRERSETT